MKKYNFANVTVENYGGGLCMYYGNLDDGTWFYVTDSWDYSFITKSDLSEYIYDDDFEDRCVADVVMELDGENHWEFLNQILKYIDEH